MGFYWWEVLLMSKSLGRYLWGRRAYSGIGIGRCKFNKKLTLGIERMRARKEINDLLELGDPCYMMDES